MGSLLSTRRASFYEMFRPCTLHRDDVAEHCEEMVGELKAADANESVPDVMDFAGPWWQELDARTSALESCVDARAALAAGMEVAYKYHECREMFRAWQSVYGK